jgi:hypothetical protein
MIMETDLSACHSPIGLFQRACYVVSAPAANGPAAGEHGQPSVAARQLRKRP